MDAYDYAFRFLGHFSNHPLFCDFQQLTAMFILVLPARDSPVWETLPTAAANNANRQEGNDSAEYEGHFKGGTT